MRTTTYKVYNDDTYCNRGRNTAKAKATITNTIIKVIEKSEDSRYNDCRLDSDFVDLLENVIAIIDGYKIHAYRKPDDMTL